MAIGSFDVVLYTCVFLLPGFIMKSIIDAFVPPQKFREAKYFLTCLLYSIINCALLSWLYVIISSLYREHPYWYWIVLLLVNIGGAVILGVLTGAIRKFDVVDRIFQKFGISKIHPIPTAWDYWFSNQKEEIWVIVTLIGGQKICGKYSYISFASSEPEERDLYLEEIYDVNERDEWTCKERTRGILIAKGQIATIEFIS
ncbi:MAG TPA: hypothetical protein IAB39_10340 [Candidatus Onthovicinus excrementipullorum]|nr:hypothetical protein [Candidatus Onthovicinus excrementipullorum]